MYSGLIHLILLLSSLQFPTDTLVIFLMGYDFIMPFPKVIFLSCITPWLETPKLALYGM